MPNLNIGFLRPMEDADLACVLDWRNHLSIRGNMYSQHEITIEEHRAWWSRVKESSKSRIYIFERQNQPTGYVAFSEISTAAGTATWGFYTAYYASKGNGSLLCFLAMDEAFRTLGLRKLSGEVIAGNAASLGLHESFGFQREGRFRDHVLIDEKLDDVVRLALFSDDWVAMRPKKLKSLTERLMQ